MNGFPVEQCLTKTIAQVLANRRRPTEFVAHRDFAGFADGKLVPVIETRCYGFVTNNVQNFRRLYPDIPVHDG